MAPGFGVLPPAASARGLIFAGNQDPALRAVFSTYAANTPQLFLDLDRDKAQTLGLAVGDAFNALQATLGGYYVNDFNLFGRTWQVNLQAEAIDRSKVGDIYRIHVRNKNGDMVPIRAVAEPRLIVGPQTVIRYNNNLLQTDAKLVELLERYRHINLSDRCSRTNSLCRRRRIYTWRWTNRNSCCRGTAATAGCGGDRKCGCLCCCGGIR